MIIFESLGFMYKHELYLKYIHNKLSQTIIFYKFILNIAYRNLKNGNIFHQYIYIRPYILYSYVV